MKTALSWLFAVLILFGLGYSAGHTRGMVELAAHKQAQAEHQRLAQQAAAKRLQDAQQRSDQLSTQLAQTLTQTATLKQEKTHALRAAATGRVCLDAHALSVLNTSPGLRVAGLDGVPTAQPGAVAAGATAGPDTHPAPAGAGDLTATDADIGTWAIGAGAAHETCRQRLDALIDWHAKPTQSAAP